MTDATTLSLGYLVGMFGVVAFGSFIPVLPTGAAVSVAAVLAEHNIAELATVAAVLLWAGVYAAIGVAGGSIFPHPWEAVAAAIAGVIAFGLLTSLVRRVAAAKLNRS